MCFGSTPASSILAKVMRMEMQYQDSKLGMVIFSLPYNFAPRPGLFPLGDMPTQDSGVASTENSGQG